MGLSCLSSVENTVLECISDTVVHGIPDAIDTLNTSADINNATSINIINDSNTDDSDSFPNLRKRLKLSDDASIRGCSSTIMGANDHTYLSAKGDCTEAQKTKFTQIRQSSVKSVTMKDRMLEKICLESEAKTRYYNDKNNREAEIHKRKMEKLQLKIDLLRRTNRDANNLSSIDLFDLVANGQ